MKFLSLVWSNLKRKKLRTSLTILSILVAFLLYGFLACIKAAFNSGVNMADADRLVTRHKVSIIQSIPSSYEARITKVPGVTLVAPQSWFGGIYQNDSKNFFATIAVEPVSFLEMYPEFDLSAEQKAEWLKVRHGAIVGEVTMKRFGWKVGDTIPLTAPIWGEPKGKTHWEFQIVGVYTSQRKGADLTSFYFRYDFFDEARERGKGEIGWFGIRVADKDKAASISKTIDEEFANSAYETKTEPEGAMMAGFAEQLGDIGTIMFAVVSAVFFTILLVAGNTMTQSVRERTEELGVLKAMGFTNGLVLMLVLLESCVIALLGGLIGLGLAWAIGAGGSPAPSVLPVFFLPQKDLLLGACMALALGIVAGTLPAIQAMRLQIAVALRRNG
jgi:putative ABC transport system permease protein